MNRTILFCLALYTYCIIASGCNKEKDNIRHLVIQQTNLQQGDNIIYEDTQLEVHAFIAGENITYSAKDKNQNETELFFEEGALKITSQGNIFTLTGDVYCMCSEKITDKICNGVWNCSATKPQGITE